MQRDWVMNFLKWQALLHKPLVSLGTPFNIFSSGISFILPFSREKIENVHNFTGKEYSFQDKITSLGKPQVFLPAAGVQRYNSDLTAVHLMWPIEKLKQGS